MDERRSWTTVQDKAAAWGPGPWVGEPDKVAFSVAGSPCLAVRHPRGHWCGYAAVLPGHPLYKCPVEQAGLLGPHGELNYAAETVNEAEGVCHVPEPGQPDAVWWFGFDCARAWDRRPADEARDRAEGHHVLLAAMEELPEEQRPVYRTLEFVVACCTFLAGQLTHWPTR